MNSILNKNLQGFNTRFPELAKQLTVTTCASVELMQSKDGSVTAKWGSVMLHSKYNPLREAQSLVEKFDSSKKDTAVFLGAGLGYALIEFVKKNPSATAIVYESDSSIFFSALSALDWTPVFNHQKLILVVGTKSEQGISLLKNFEGSRIEVFRVKAQSAYDEHYFDTIEAVVKQNCQRDEVNTNTLEKFAHLWLSNSLRNLEYISSLEGIKKYFNRGKEIPFVIIAAGPSLEVILPVLKEIQKRAVTVCVDTALHACLKAGVEPDFIFLTDPQYYCSLHLEFLKAPSSVLVTEVAAYPSVFRFECREKVLFTSQFSVGQYFENRFDIKGRITAGGSVTTSAWDFARLCGTDKIFIAGLDLGFPMGQTHIRGSQFEQKVHMSSNRLAASELQNIRSLFSASPCIKKDYDGNPVLSDKKMDIFSWWFENECTKAREFGLTTYSLTSKSRAINGIEKFSLEEFLTFPEVLYKKEIFFSTSVYEKSLSSSSDFIQIKNNFKNELDELEETARKAIGLCNTGLADSLKRKEILCKLNSIDSHIMNSSIKNSASLVFPTSRQLEKMSAAIDQSTPSARELFPLRYSLLIYTQLKKSVQEILKYL